MKTLPAALLASTLLTATPAIADQADMVFIKPGLGQSKCLETLNPIVFGFAKSATRGDTQSYLNADTLEQITDLTVPDNKLYETPSERRVSRTNQHAAAQLRQFCDTPLTGSKSLPFSEIWRFVGNNMQPDMATKILVIGHPITDDPNSPNTSMVEGLVPSDGHLRTTRTYSPYGLLGEEQLLTNVKVNFVTVNNEWVKSPAQAAETERFITLSITERGGDLASFAPDIETVLSRMTKGQSNRLTYRPLSKTDSKLYMTDFSSPPPQNESLFERPLSEVRLTPQQLRLPLEDVRIALAWSCECDTDLVVTTQAGAPPLYWNNRQTQDGVFVKDYQTANAQRGFETVILSRPVKLSDLQIASNLYSGSPQNGVEGKIRIAIGGKTFETAFHISATNGNSGAGLQNIIERNAVNDPHWVLIDPIAVISGE